MAELDALATQAPSETRTAATEDSLTTQVCLPSADMSTPLNHDEVTDIGYRTKLRTILFVAGEATKESQTDAPSTACAPTNTRPVGTPAVGTMAAVVGSIVDQVELTTTILSDNRVPRLKLATIMSPEANIMGAADAALGCASTGPHS